MELTYYIVFYLIIVNVIGFLSMGIDKYKAKRKLWRIKERTLFIIAALGGSIGSIFGMKYFHHKTLHKEFVYGMPLILLLQITVAVAIISLWQ